MNIEKITIGGILLIGMGIISACSVKTDSSIPVQHTTSNTISSDSSFRQSCSKGGVDDGPCPQGAVASQPVCNEQNCLSAAQDKV